MPNRKNRVEIEHVENGYTIRCWKYEENEKQDEYGYVEPETFVAKDDDELLKIVKDNL